MKMLRFVLYKEFLELRSSRWGIWGLALQGIGLGLLFPIVSYLRLAGILPAGLTGIGLCEAELAMLIEEQLARFIPLLLPFFFGLAASFYVIPSIVQETETRTLERVLSLPLSWRTFFFGKLIFHLIIFLVFAYIMVLSYFLLSSFILEAFQPVAFGAYLLVVVPAVVFYSVSAGLFVSAKARTMKSANLYGGMLISGLFMTILIVSQVLAVELGRDIMLVFGGILFIAGFILAYCTAKVNPERLICRS